MDHKTRRQVETAACERRYGIADDKGAEYSGAGKTYQEAGADTLNNFKSVAKRRGVSPVTVLMVYLSKHLDSIDTITREAEAVDPNDPLDLEYKRVHRYAEGEGIVSRLDDARNYLDLLECLLIDTGAISGAVLDKWYPRIPRNPLREEAEAAENALCEGCSLCSNPDNELDDAEVRRLHNAGLTEGFDGVYRGATKIDSSVAPDALRETPICHQDPETGELGA